MSAPCRECGPGYRVGDEGCRHATTRSDFVHRAMNDDLWAGLLEELGPVALAEQIKRKIASIGQQEQARNSSLAAARTDDSIPDDEYEVMKRGFLTWRRSVARIRTRLQQRLAEIQPEAQALIDAHQADRRALTVLAKRTWLWEEGREDRLEYALDDFTISDGPQLQERITLRDLIERIATQGVIEP